jgi:hypothetical protein
VPLASAVFAVAVAAPSHTRSPAHTRHARRPARALRRASHRPHSPARVARATRRLVQALQAVQTALRRALTLLASAAAQRERRAADLQRLTALRPAPARSCTWHTRAFSHWARVAALHLPSAPLLRPCAAACPKAIPAHRRARIRSTTPTQLLQTRERRRAAESVALSATSLASTAERWRERHCARARE